MKTDLSSGRSHRDTVNGLAQDGLRKHRLKPALESVNESVMKRAGRICFGCLALTLSLHADSGVTSDPTTRRYQQILTRNGFGLKPPAQPQPEPGFASPMAPDDLKLTGIASWGHRKSAYFVTDAGGNPSRSFSLVEGQKDGSLEVLAIDVVRETVLLRRDGADLLLSLKANGIRNPDLARLEEKQFVEEHTRAHEAREQLDRLRVEHERAEAEMLLQRQREQIPAAGGTKNEASLEHVAFDPTGQRMITITPDGTARVWDATTGQLIENGEQQPEIDP